MEANEYVKSILSRRKTSLNFKITLYLALVFLILFTSFSIIQLTWARSSRLEKYQQSSAKAVSLLSMACATHVYNFNTDGADQTCSGFLSLENGNALSVTIKDDSGGKITEKFFSADTNLNPEDQITVEAAILWEQKTIGKISAVYSREGALKGLFKEGLTIFLQNIATAAVILFLLQFLISRLILSPIKATTQILEDLSKGSGDLTRTLPEISQDEIGKLSILFNRFTANIRSMVGDISSVTAVLKTNSSDMKFNASGMNLNASALKEHAEKTEALSSASSREMGRLMQSAIEVSDQLSSVASASSEMSASISEIARGSENSRQQSSQAVTAASESSKRLAELTSLAGEIGSFAETMSDISGQVKLLSLNATIEAVRAGESGRGFVVVASEVKELARQSNASSAEIAALVQRTRSAIESNTTEISSILQMIQNLNNLSATVAAATEEQSATTNDISKHIEGASSKLKSISQSVGNVGQSIEKVSEETAATRKLSDSVSNLSHKLDEASAELDAASAKLLELVGRFKI